MSDNPLLELSMDLAVASIRFSDRISGHSSLKNQFERSSTGIGANIREANYAQSRADFIAKLQIALKECYETEYWLELFERSGISDPETVLPLKRSAGSVRRLLISSINTAKDHTT